MSMKSTSLFLLSTLAFLLSSCAGSTHPRLVTPSGWPISPRYLEIYSEPHAATLHFPAGVYTLNAVDKIGYYYRAPRKIAERAGQGSVGRDGGIFVSKRDPQNCAVTFFARERSPTSAISLESNIALSARTFPLSSDF